MAAIDPEQIADNAVLIGLLTRSELRECRDEAEDGSIEALTKTMMRKGHLTSWQRDRLLKGETTGFILGGAKVLFHLAEGTFARVYRGRKMPGEQSVAIKVLRKRFVTEAGAVTRFAQEAEAGLKLLHPNIVQIYEHGEQDGNHFMIMEYVEGSNLRDFLKIRKNLSWREALPMMVGLAKGLQYSFDQGVTHRDIKATNVLIGSKGEAKLVDFGLATMDLDDFSSNNSQSVRTVDYSALERGCGSAKGDPKSDIYFLGCVYYQMLTGAPAMAETETSDQLAKMLKRSFSAIKPISEHRNAPPAELARIIEKMMKWDLRARYQDMDAVVNDLLTFQDSVEDSPAEGTPTTQGSGTGVVAKKEARKHEVGSIEDLFAAAFGDDALRQRNILCVEAQESIQDAFRKTFTKMGYKIVLVRDANRASDRFNENLPDAVIFDADGLGPNSFQAFLAMQDKAREENHDLKSILILGPRQGDLASKVPAGEATVILNKPLKMKDVTDAITQLVPV